MFYRYAGRSEKGRALLFSWNILLSREGRMWGAILEVLEEKVKQGVDVRLIYDDMGCVQYPCLPSTTRNFRLRGIKCAAFNPVRPILNIVLNKPGSTGRSWLLTAHTGYTGGLNLADE